MHLIVNALDAQSLRKTVAVLTPELPALELTAPEKAPQEQFSGCRLVAQLLAPTPLR